MTRYLMSVAGSDIAGHWEVCKAASLSGAKREAAIRFGAGFDHHRILIGEPWGNGVPRVIAERPMRGRWSDKDVDPTAKLRQQRRRERLRADGGRGLSILLTEQEAAALDRLCVATGRSQRDAVGAAIQQAADGA